MNAVFIVEKTTGDIVWMYDRELDHQHEALMIERGSPGEGNIILFDNGLRSLHRYRRSVVLEIDPHDKRIVWQYGSDYFFSPVGGVQQRLEDGNTLITSSSGQRVFEVDPAGSLVWEWTPPFGPMRSQFYRPGFCPQLEGLSPPEKRPVRPPEDRAFIDQYLYQFGLVHETTTRVSNGRTTRFLKDLAGCRTLLIPDNAALTLSWGLTDEAASDTLARNLGAVFSAFLRPEGSRERHVLLADTVRMGEAPRWRQKRIPLYEYGYRVVDLCLEATGAEDSALRRFAVWGDPRIVAEQNAGAPGDDRAEGATPSDEDRVRQRLEALGYVD